MAVRLAQLADHVFRCLWRRAIFYVGAIYDQLIVGSIISETSIRRYFFSGAKLLLSAGVLWFIFSKIKFDSVISYFSPQSVPGLLIAFIVLFLHTAPVAWRFDRLSHAYRQNMTPWTAWRLYMLGLTFNQLLPSGIGGDAVRAGALVRRDWPLSKAVGAVLMDRVSGFLVLALSLLAVSIFLFSESQVRPTIGPALAIVSIAFLILFVSVYFLRNSAAAKKLPGVARVRDVIASVLSFKYSTGLVANLFTTSFASHLLAVMSVFIAAQALEIDLTFIACFVGVSSAIFAAAIPISFGGWGLREGAMAAALSQFGLTAPEGLALALTFSMGLLFLAAAGTPLLLTGRDAALKSD